MSEPKWVHSRRRRSSCRATRGPGPPGTCLRPRRGTRNPGSWSQTSCRNLFPTRGRQSQATPTNTCSARSSHAVCVSGSGSRSFSLTLLAVRLAVLQVEGLVSDWLLAAGAQEAVDVPGLLEGVDHFLPAGAERATKGLELEVLLQ